MIATFQIYMEHIDVANGDIGQCKEALGLCPFSMYVLYLASAKLELENRLIP